MSNGTRHIIGDECTHSPNQAKCNQNGSLSPSLPLPSTHVDPPHLNDNCSRISYYRDNLRCNISNGTRYIIGGECTRCLCEPEMAHWHRCYHCRALMLTLLTKMMIVVEPPIKDITCVVIWAILNVISSVRSALNGQIKPTATKMAHCHHCYHSRALMLRFLAMMMIVLEPPIRGIICVVI